ncbi:MAG: guanylate kinase [Clostridia bacterium]|nr:guanylate kinase [Clostridia bacterium]
MNKGALFIISGPSGTGKGTVCKELISRGDVYLSVSATTRDKRVGETDGETYHFTDKASFERMISNGEMLEWANYNGNYYGTPKAAVEKTLFEGRNVILEIEPQGALAVKEKMPEAVLIFVIPPSVEVLKGRLLDRGRESEEEISQRLAASIWEMEQAGKYNYIVENDDLSDCVDRISAIMAGVVDMRNKVYSLLEEAKERK